MPHEFGQIAVAVGLIVVGLLWARDALRRWSEYSLAEDFKACLRPRWKYSSGPAGRGPRLLEPGSLVLMGIAMLVVLLARRPAA